MALLGPSQNVECMPRAAGGMDDRREGEGGSPQVAAREEAPSKALGKTAHKSGQQIGGLWAVAGEVLFVGLGGRWRWERPG